MMARNTLAALQPPAGATQQAWVVRISACWRASLEAILEVGRLLSAAKGSLPHGGFGAMIESELPFSARTAQMLMAIAADKRLTNPNHGSHLPPSWRTMFELTKLSDEEFDRGVHQQIIRPDMERKDVEIIRPTPPRAPQSSDGSGSPVSDNPLSDPTTLSLQQGLDTSSNPGTADHSPQGEGSDAAFLANPERQPGVPDGSPASPGPSEAQMPGGGLAIAHNRVEPSDSLDFFPTPPWATRALVEHVLGHLDRKQHCQFQTAWEPASGEGHMAEPLGEYFREVVASDIKDYGYSDQYVVDFLSVEQLNRQYDADWIITNPPFGDNIDKFILKALSLAGTGVAMLVRMQCLETVGRYERIYRDTPPTLIAFFAERCPIHKGRWEPEGDTFTAYVWLVWIKGAKPEAPFWIPPGCRETLTRPGDAERFTTHPVTQAKRDSAGVVVDHDNDGVVPDDEAPDNSDSERVVLDSIPSPPDHPILNTVSDHGGLTGVIHGAPLVTDQAGGAPIPFEFPELPDFLRRTGAAA